MDSSLTHAWLVSVLPTLYGLVHVTLLLPPLFLFLLWGWYQWRFRRVLRATSKLETGLPALPLLGHTYLLLLGYGHMIMTMITVGKRLATQGVKTICLWLGPYPVICVLGADDIQTVVSGSKTEKSGEYRFVEFALGNGLLIAPEHIHRVTRRHVTPLFRARNLEQLMPVFNQTSRHLVRDVSEHVGRDDVSLLGPAAVVAIRSVSCVIFGPEVDIDTNSEEFRGLRQIGKGIAEIVTHRFLKLWLWPDAVFKFLWRKRIERIHNHWRRFAEGPLKVLQYKDNLRRRTDENENDPRPLTLPEIYSTLYKHYPQFTDQDLHFEMLTFLMTGSDSTRIAICSCLLSLAALPNIQEKTYQEILSKVGSSDKDVTIKDIQDMPYLDQVFKETLRKYCIIPFILRRAKEDIQLSDCTVPAGATIGVSLLSLHYDPAVFPDPERFDPDHFSPEKTAEMKRYTFLPFSGGSRNCIGSLYAALLVKTVVIHVLKRFHLTTSVDIENLRFKVALAMIAGGGYRVRLRRRS